VAPVSGAAPQRHGHAIVLAAIPRAPIAMQPKQKSESTVDRITNEQITPIDGEPWVHLADGAELASWNKDDEIGYNQRNRQTEKQLFFRRVFDFLKENEIRGDYHEYGCHRCRTFRMALTEARRHNL